MDMASKLLSFKFTSSCRKNQKQPLRSTAYGKVTVEELDSDDEDVQQDDDPLAEADRMVRKIVMQASEATSDVHARAQAAKEKYKCALSSVRLLACNPCQCANAKDATIQTFTVAVSFTSSIAGRQRITSVFDHDLMSQALVLTVYFQAVHCFFRSTFHVHPGATVSRAGGMQRGSGGECRLHCSSYPVIRSC